MKLIPLMALAVVFASVGCATTGSRLCCRRLLTQCCLRGASSRSDDIARVRDAGIRQVIDLIPDAETPDFDEAAGVSAAGLAYSNLPLRGAAALTRENVIAFDALVRKAKRPVLVPCASGNYVGAMAALRAAWVEGKPAEEAIAIGKAWGLKGLQAELRRRIESGAPQSGT